MPTNNRLPEGRLHGFAIHSADYWVLFFASATVASNKVTSQDERLIDVSAGVTGIVRVSAGVYDVELGSRFNGIGVRGVNVRVSGDWVGHAISVTSGLAAANKIRVHTRLAGVLTDPEADVDLSFHLIMSKLEDR